MPAANQGGGQVFDWIAGRLRCAKGLHERSEKHIHRLGRDEKFVSKCCFCGVHMTRRTKRDWIVTPKGAR
jgi:hypothetical protein